MDIISLIIGFAIGMIVVAIAIEFGTKKTTETTPASRQTKKWSISEISNPRIMAEHLGEVEIPENSKVLVNHYRNKDILEGLDVKEHTEIRGNFIVGDDRALILAGPVKKDEIVSGLWKKKLLKNLTMNLQRCGPKEQE